MKISVTGMSKEDFVKSELATALMFYGAHLKKGGLPDDCFDEAIDDFADTMERTLKYESDTRQLKEWFWDHCMERKVYGDVIDALDEFTKKLEEIIQEVGSLD